MKAVGYIRVSTEEQSEGQRAQADTIHSRFPLAQLFVDAGVSGASKLDKRPALLEAIGALESGDVLVVAKRDRLGRDPFVVAMIESAVARKGGKIVSCAGEGTEGDDPASILMRRMIDAFAEYERLIIKSRTKSALAAKKRRKERVGQIPFGFRLAKDGFHLEEDPDEKKIIRKIYSLRRSGLSIRRISEVLNGDRTPARGKKWYPTTVARILKAC